MKTRIAFVNGIWQLCMVTAGMWHEREQHPDREYRDFLVVYTYKTGNFELAKFVLKLSQAFWNWKGTLMLGWVPRDWSEKVRQNRSLAVDSMLSTFGISNTSEVDELWICKLQFLEERFFADIFSKAQLVLYEDGLHTYAPTRYLFNLPEFPLNHPKKAVFTVLFWLQEIISGQLNWRHHGVKRSHLRRAKTFYSVLGQQLQISEPFQQVSTEYLKPELLQKFFSHLYQELDCNFYQNDSDRKVALFLGSNLSHLHSFPKEREVDVFVKAIEQVRNQGYTILWKEHPRSLNPLFEDIIQKISSEHLVCLTSEQKLPIELLLAQGNIDLCCSTLSSSLFYLRSIYGIQTMTCVESLLPYLKGDFYTLSKLTVDTIDQAF